MKTYDEYIYSSGTHYISNNGHDENGAYSGGTAGDQTGDEWCLRSWYDRPWDCVLRYPDEKVALLIAQLGCAAALNDKIGYDQNQRDSYWTQLKKAVYDPSAITTACEADCSAGVIANVKAAGYLMGISALQGITATYTGDMKSAFKAAGFKVLTASKYVSEYSYLKPGDILLNESHHTATNVTKGAKASFDPTTESSGTSSLDEIAQEVIAGKWGNLPDRQTALEAAGYDYNAVQARVNEILGADTSTTETNGIADATSFEDGHSTGTKYKVAAYSGLNVRNGPGTVYDILETLSYGASVIYYGYYDKDSSGDKWLLVTANGQTGWVCAKYVT